MESVARCASIALVQTIIQKVCAGAFRCQRYRSHAYSLPPKLKWCSTNKESMYTQLHDVVIVGAGPTGLALAAELNRLGISSFILDKQPEGANTSRAAVIHARTLEVLEPLGATKELLALGVIVPFFRIRDRDRVLATIDFREL